MKFLKEIEIPMNSTCRLDKDEEGKSIDQKLYRGMIESLLYLTVSRPDILFSVCACARFQSNPIESHLLAVKRIIRYLKGWTNLGLWYSKQSSLDLIDFTDADYGGYKIDRKSTTVTCQFLGLNLISWHSKKQNFMALSTTEAEYIAASKAVKDVFWYKKFAAELGVMSSDAISLYCDIALAKEPRSHQKSKHIERWFHLIRDYLEKGYVKVKRVDSTDNVADPLTKPLGQ